MHIKGVQMSLLLVFLGVAETIGKAKGNASQAISELINIVSDITFQENEKEEDGHSTKS